MGKTMTGTVRRNDLEGGFWELVTDSGDRYQLRGGDDGLRVEGQRVAIDGKVARDAMGFAMASPILDVARWSKA